VGDENNPRRVTNARRFPVGDQVGLIPPSEIWLPASSARMIVRRCVPSGRITSRAVPVPRATTTANRRPFGLQATSRYRSERAATRTAGADGIAAEQMNACPPVARTNVRAGLRDDERPACDFDDCAPRISARTKGQRKTASYSLGRKAVE
jgi:hypothetical protein